MSLDRQTLVLNASYEAVNVVSAKRALTLVMGGKAYVEEPSEIFIRTSRMKVQIPSVIRLLIYRRVPRSNKAVSRKSILLRDRHTCQYCQRPFPPAKLTLDHVIPKSSGGRNSWENLVTACVPCNNRKGSMSPEEAGMQLAAQPRAFGMHSKHRQAASSEPSWDKYLFF